MRLDNRGRVAVQMVPRGETRTRQSEAGETDVNAIVARHRKTGVVSHLNAAPPMYGDFSLANDLKAALDLQHRAVEGFMTLPAAVRKAADHDPVRFLQMLSDPQLVNRLVEAGLNVGDDGARGSAPPGQLPMERKPDPAAADTKPSPSSPGPGSAGGTPPSP